MCVCVCVCVCVCECVCVCMKGIIGILPVNHPFLIVRRAPDLAFSF